MYVYRAVVLSVFVVSVVAVDEALIQKCHKIMKPDKLKCCITTTSDPDVILTPEIKECYDKPDSITSCEVEECEAKKLGIYGSDGNLNKEALTHMLESQFNDDKDQHLMTILKEKCLTGDVSIYGMTGTCEFKKMKHCLHIQYLKVCPEWKDEGECDGMEKIVTECTADF